MSYWVKFKDAKHTGACFDLPPNAKFDEAYVLIKAQAEKLTGCLVESVKVLPYPASPRLGIRTNDCPDFCLHGDRCAGSTSCPRPYACSE